MNRIHWDIETGPSERAAEFIGDFAAPSSWKDKDKIERSVEEKKQKALEEAALSAITGRVLVVGIDGDDTPGNYRFFEGDEKTLLQKFWEYYASTAGFKGSGKCYDWVGFNTHSFDWRFVYQRSLVNGITKMPRIFNDRGYLPEHLIDLRNVWTGGDKYAKGSLDVLCRLLGIPGKKEGMTGKSFATLYKEDPAAAREYLIRDLACVRLLAERLL